MTTRAVCPSCDHGYQVANDLIGKNVRCTSCQKVVVLEPKPQFEVVDDEPAVTKADRPRRRVKKARRSSPSVAKSRIIGFVAAGIAVIALILGGIWWWKRPGTARSLSQLIAQLDRNEPGWRFEGLEAQRQAVSNDQNSATVISNSRKLFDKNWLPGEQQEAIRNSPPNQKLDAGTMSRLKSALDAVEPALVEARKVAGMPRGRHPIVYSKNGQLTDTPHLLPLREVASLLIMDAFWRCQNGDANGAVSCCQAALNVGRSVYDEPFSMSQLVRLACQNLTVSALERVLAQSQPADEPLAALQELLIDESMQPCYLIVAKCERAFTDYIWSALQSGALTPSDAKKINPELDSKAALLSDPKEVEKAYFWMLRHTNQLVEIAQLPSYQQQKPLEAWDKLPPDAPPLAGAMQMAGSRMALACQRGSARMACAATAIAAERYRQANGRWPDKLNALVPGQLKQIPIDPFDGKPIRMIRTSDGLVIYAVGADQQDNSGVMDVNDPNRPGVDTGFRLYDRK